MVTMGQVQLSARKRSAAQDFGFTINNILRKSTTIPFKVYSNLIVISAKVDNYPDTLNFILDTGVTSVFITDPALAEKLGLEYVRKVNISGAGQDSVLTANVSVDHDLKIGNITGHRQNLVVLSEDILQLSEYLGIPIHGIFGHDFFSAFVVTIDWSHLQIVTTKPNRFVYKKKYGDKYPIVVTQSKPYTDAISVTSDEQNDIPLRLVIDTSAGHALLLNSDKAVYKMPEKVIRANLGRGLNGEIYGNIGRIPMMKLGEIEIENVIASFPDSISFSMKFPPTDANRQGSIGCEFLRRFKMTLNYEDGYMALKPIKNRLNEAFEHDMSGVDVRAKGTDFRSFVIEDIVPDSPADLAGLKSGDEIIFLNNKSVKDLSITEIFKTLSRKEGKNIEIFYRRNGDLGFAYFQLKRVI